MAESFSQLSFPPSQALTIRTISMSALHHTLNQLEMFQQELCSEFFSLKTSNGTINMAGFFGVIWSVTFIKLTSGIDKMKLALATVRCLSNWKLFSSKVSSSLVKENIFKCCFKQFDSRSKGRLHFRITQGKRGKEPCQFFVKQFSALFSSILRFNICMKAFEVIFLQTFCGNILVLVQIQKPILASTGNQIWNPNSAFLFGQSSLWKDSSEESKRAWTQLAYSQLQLSSPQDLILFLNSAWLKSIFNVVCFFFCCCLNWLGSPLELFHKMPDPSWLDVPVNGRKTACSAEAL